MEIGKKLYVTTRKDWRSWLAKNHAKETEIWLVYHRKGSGRRRIPYNAAVEEALCYGWIDSILKRIDGDTFAQRFSPRRPGAKLSAMNVERLRRLKKKGKVTKAGLVAVGGSTALKGSKIPADILERLKRNKQTWKNFQAFPASYKRIRIGWIEGARRRPEVFEQRLKYFLKMTAANKRYGMVQ